MKVNIDSGEVKDADGTELVKGNPASHTLQLFGLKLKEIEFLNSCRDCNYNPET